MPELYDIVNIYKAKASAILDVGTVMQEVVTLTTPALELGDYMLAYAFEVDFNGTKNQPAWFRMGGTYGNATEFAVIAGDATGNEINRYYAFPKEHPGGAITISLDFKKDAGVTTFDVNFVDVMVMRVG